MWNDTNHELLPPVIATGKPACIRNLDERDGARSHGLCQQSQDQLVLKPLGENEMGIENGG